MADKKYVQRTIKIPSKYGPEERRAIAIEVLNHIRERTSEGLDRNGNKFPSYSKEYVDSRDFEIAGKSKSNVDLKLSGDMLAVMDLISSSRGKIVIGFNPSAEEAGRAEGNIRGSYGKPTGSKSKARDFLGIEPDELQRILEKYPLDDREESKDRAKEILDETSASEGDFK